MKVLVTGASGFVGSTLCDELGLRGVETLALMRKTSSRLNLAQAKFQPVEGDLRDAESLKAAVEHADVVIHVAGVVAARSTADFFTANAQGTRNLLEAVKVHGKKIKRFVFVSSLAAAGPSRPDRAHREDDSNEPVSDYGLSKLAGENAVDEYKSYFPVTIVRPPAVYGPRDRGVFTFFQAVNSGVLPLIGLSKNDSRRYSFVHVDDLVQGIVLAALKNETRSGEVFYLSGEGEFSWEEAMRAIATGLGRKPISVRLPIPVMKGAAALCTAYSKISGAVLPFGLDKIKEIEAPSWTCSNEKAKSQLAFAPYWSLEKGMAATAKWYLDNGWLK